MLFDTPTEKHYPRTIGGLVEFAKDRMSALQTNERLVDGSGMDLLCGLGLLSVPLIITLFS
jgi:hypothetical protein